MRHLLLVVLFLATVGPTSVIGQGQPTLVGEDQRRLLTLAADPSDVAGQELSTGTNCWRDASKLWANNRDLVMSLRRPGVAPWSVVCLTWRLSLAASGCAAPAT